MEDDYMICNKSRSKVNWRALNKSPTLAKNNMDLVPTISFLVHQFHCSGKVVIQSNRFMYLGESCKEILEEYETDLTDYDEAIR